MRSQEIQNRFNSQYEIAGIQLGVCPLTYKVRTEPGFKVKDNYGINPDTGEFLVVKTREASDDDKPEVVEVREMSLEEATNYLKDVEFFYGKNMGFDSRNNPRNPSLRSWLESANKRLAKLREEAKKQSAV